MTLLGPRKLGISCRNEKKTSGRQSEAAGDVDYVMLMGEQRRERNEDKPGKNDKTPSAAQISLIDVREEQKQRRV